MEMERSGKLRWRGGVINGEMEMGRAMDSEEKGEHAWKNGERDGNVDGNYLPCHQEQLSFYKPLLLSS